MANNCDDDDDDDSFSDGSDGDEVPQDIEHGFRRYRWSTTFSRRATSSLYPLQFMEMEVYLAAAEFSLSMSIFLSIIAVLLVSHHHRLSSLLVHWQRMTSVSARLSENIKDMLKQIKKEVSHILLLVQWAKMHGELAGFPW